MSRRFEDLVAVMHRLRAPGGCPWDREQSYASLRQYVLEEAYEVVDAIDRGATDKLADECGDLLLQVMFLSELGHEAGAFSIEDVVSRIHDKLVRRHPHVFGEVAVDDAAHVVRNWEAIKDGERAGEDSGDDSALAGVSLALPALVRAEKLGSRAARAGFDWSSAEQIVAKIEEEAAEVRQALAAGDRRAAGRELGDLLFAAAQLARRLDVDPEDAAREACLTFERRYRHMEHRISSDGRRPSDLSDEELDVRWREAKASTSQA